MPFETTPRISRAAERFGERRPRVAPGGASGTRSPGRHVPNADDHLELARPRLHAGQAQGVAVRVVADLDHPGDDDAGDPLPRTLDRLDLRALAREQLRQLLGRQVGRAQLPQPGQDDLHAAPSNRSRNRTSPSTNSRMSLHAVPDHRHALDPHAEREPRVPLGVDAAVLEHLRMDHPGAQQLEPSVAADAAPDAAADEARHRGLAAGLDEREVVGREPHAHVLPEHLVRERLQRPPEVGERDPLVDERAPRPGGRRAGASRRRPRAGRCARGRPPRSAAPATPSSGSGPRWSRCGAAGPSTSTYRESFSVRAGWSGGMLSASKLCHSSSISGPSATR